MIDDLIAFLRARFEEEAAEAQAAIDDPPMKTLHRWNGPKEGEQVPVGVGWWKRRLAEINAKQRAVACCEACQWAEGGGMVDLADDVLRSLAMPYREHPDFQQEWWCE